MPAVFAGRDLRASYGSARALADVTVEVPAGALAAVLGANGAGKTTLLRVLAGLQRPQRGAVLLDGRDITGLPGHRIARLGVTLVPEGRGTFPALTVEQNLRMAGLADGSLDRVTEMFPVLGSRVRQEAGTLSGGEQQMLSLARCLSGDARILLLDEPSLALAPRMVDEIFAAIQMLRRAGKTIVLVEQYVKRALEVADLVFVLRKGTLAFAGEPAELARRGALESAYLGAVGA